MSDERGLIAVVHRARAGSRRRAMMRWLLALLLLPASVQVVACPLCLGAYRSSLADQLVDAQSAVLADLDSNGRAYRIAAVIKGDAPVGGVIDASLVERTD